MKATKLDYRIVLNNMIEHNSAVKGYRTQLAKAAGVQLSYLLAVTKGKARFTPDQAFDLCRYWNFSESETEKFVLQVLLEKATSHGWKKFLLDRIEQIEQTAPSEESVDMLPRAGSGPSLRD